MQSGNSHLQRQTSIVIFLTLTDTPHYDFLPPMKTCADKGKNQERNGEDCRVVYPAMRAVGSLAQNIRESEWLAVALNIFRLEALSPARVIEHGHLPEKLC
jgi:hypothetical protein